MAYSEPCQTAKTELFAKVVNWKPLIIFAKASILDVWQDSEYASENWSLQKVFLTFSRRIYNLPLQYTKDCIYITEKGFRGMNKKKICFIKRVLKLKLWTLICKDIFIFQSFAKAGIELSDFDK